RRGHPGGAASVDFAGGHSVDRPGTDDGARPESARAPSEGWHGGGVPGVGARSMARGIANGEPRGRRVPMRVARASRRRDGRTGASTIALGALILACATAERSRIDSPPTYEGARTQAPAATAGATAPLPPVPPTTGTPHLVPLFPHFET